MFLTKRYSFTKKIKLSLVILTLLSFFHHGKINVLAEDSSDTTPPALTDLVFSPSEIDVNLGDQQVDFTWEITDDLSGLSQAFVRFTSPSGQIQDSNVYLSQLISGDLNNGVYKDTVTFPQYSESGIWEIT